MTTIYNDFETFYSQSYSLKKMSTEAYIRDSQFKAHGCVITVDDEEALWIPHAQLPGALRQYAEDYPDAEWVAHNAQFDMAILAWHYDIHPKIIRDTLSMARIANFHGKHSLDALSRHYNLGQKGDVLIKTLGVETLDPLLEQQLAEYCVQDVELLRRLYKRLSTDLQASLGQVRYAREMALIDLTVRMFTEPMLEVNADLLRDRLSELEAERAAALQSAGVDESVLMSNQQFGALLAAQGVDVPATLRKTDSDFLELREDSRVGHLVRGRLAVKSVSELRRTEKFIAVAGRGTLPMPLKYHGAHTGRWSGSDGLNVQNLNRGSALRRCLQAPEGHVLVVVDSAQIEARVLAWLAGETELLQQFADGEDVYVRFAMRIWPDQQIDATRRFVGKTCILGLGYGVGHVKLHAQVVVKQPEATLDDAAGYVSVYRNTYTAIRQLWREADRMIRLMMYDQREEVCGLVIEHEKIRLPSGRWLHYPDLRLTGEGFEYGAKQRLYGAKLVENCIAEGTAVLTDQGWVRIENVTTSHRVFDGFEFANHGGILYNGVKPCMFVDGVAMTPDHRVLTNEGWKTASQNPQPFRPYLWGIPGDRSGAQRWEKAILDSTVPVWVDGGARWHVADPRESNELWVSRFAGVEKTQNTRNEQAPGICGVAQHVRPVPTAIAPSMAQLWRAWNYGVRAVGEVVRGVLGRYGANLQTGAYIGQDQQRRRLFARELPVGTARNAGPQQTQQHVGEHAKRSYDGMRSGRPVWHQTNDIVVPVEPRVGLDGRAEHTSGCEKPVYDIVNCGKRHQFVVMGEEGPMVVHNCVQAIARDVVADQMLVIARKYRITTMTHDEIVFLAREDEAEDAFGFAQSVMRAAPRYAAGLPLSSSGGWAREYSK